MYAEISINSNGTRSYYSVFGKPEDVALALETAAAQNDTLRQALAILTGSPKPCNSVGDYMPRLDDQGVDEGAYAD